jgi:DNA-binding transcriptional LysR family regulator
MNDRLSALRLFTRVGRLGSFSAGGREFGISQPTASRVISQLERDLGVSLFTRTTRAVKLTDAGSDFLARVEPILANLEEAEQAIQGSDELRGVLRVGLSSSLALREVAPRLPVFMHRHPRLRVELITNDQRQDFVLEGVDVGMRFGPLPDSTATAKRIGAWPRVIVAAPSYLARAGTPQKPSDLATHSVIVAPSRLGRSWSFRKRGRVSSVTVTGRLVVTFNEVGLAAAVAGLGLVSMTVGAVRRELLEGSLVRVLADWEMDEIELHAVFPAGKAAKPAAREFVDYLVAEFMKDPGLR